MILRPVGLEACFILADLHDRAFERPWTALEFEDLLKSPGVFAVLGEAGEPAVEKGFILCRSIAGEAEILTLGVDPAARRRGWGAALVEMAAGLATETGAEAMFLEVAADNLAAIGLYAATGFARVGVRMGYYPHPDGAKDALVMRRTLNS
ncbi:MULTISPECIES: GNAT family N-acetyltransferase [unclassified Caulobacter]|uniref:GNAT family N-acetyltransferase n=1 Tax=unclassified Caulobacter TaxID=2648921 RepID=UPI000D3922CB|nr:MULTISPECIES: GNAT family N-acetyltransferase [unclassified Caulobacter]PTS91126.1 ribosomal-protein-alanine acetyltransferase [Caulobacter sp. HMWF009]PTT09869.1 ribosomal-protein-alanine acetyltransferase [Caulobacter sp. HMWF025]PTT72939.1 ribosomal-protein-alanine acetyltransferase [Pseudomonas sp. HMWF010]